MAERSEQFSPYNIIKDNKLHELGLNEPAVVSLPREDLTMEDFIFRSHLAAYVSLESNGYKVSDFTVYGTEAVLVVRKKFGKWLDDKVLGVSGVRELQQVHMEDGNRGPVHVCESYFRNGKFVGKGWGGGLTAEEKRAARYPELIQRSPFSYCNPEDLDLPVDFANAMRDIRKA